VCVSLHMDDMLPVCKKKNLGKCRGHDEHFIYQMQMSRILLYDYY